MSTLAALSAWGCTHVGALVGAFGLLAIEGSYVPQILRLWRLRRAEEVSMLFPALNLLGRLCALCYSVGRADSIFVGGFLLGILLRATLLSQVIWYRSRERAAGPLTLASAPGVLS